MDWAKVLFFLWAFGSVLWGASMGLLLRDDDEVTIQLVALGPPLGVLAVGSALAWAVKQFRS
jgi:hypothetical protein